MVACQNEAMATQATENPFTDSPLPLYRLDVDTYHRLADAGALEGLDVDRETKANMYAWTPVPTYWLVDVPAKTIEVRTEPGPDGYGRCEIYGVGMKVPSPAEGVDDLDVAELFA